MCAVYMFMCMYMCVQVHEYTCIHVYGSQRLTLGVFNCSPPCASMCVFVCVWGGCVHSCVSARLHLLWCACRGERTTLDVGPSLPTCLRSGSLFVVLGAYVDSLALRLLVVLLFVLLTSHRSPDITDVCCHAFTWALGEGTQTQVPMHVWR